MELYEYGRILRRRWWIPAVLTLLVAGFSALQLQPWASPPPSSYTATTRLLLGVLPVQNADTTSYDPRYYAWLTSEYLVDDFTEVVGSELFAEQVSNRLATQQISLSPGLIRGSATTGKQHRIITLQLTWPDADEAAAIASAASAELEGNASRYFRQLGTEGATVEILDRAIVTPVGTSTRQRIEFPLRVALALLAGLGLAFLVDYLDNSIRLRSDLEELGLNAIGTIPRH